MGSEMCIRDRSRGDDAGERSVDPLPSERPVARGGLEVPRDLLGGCLLYTSDAADERSSVDLGGRRIIKKKKKRRHTHVYTVQHSEYTHT